jgi:hypothetical protein
MDTTTPGTAPLVLLTTDDPERCAQALLHLLPTMPPEWPLAVVAHGTAALECQQVAQEMLRRVSFASVGVCSGGRLDAINEGLRYLLDAPALYVLDDDARVVSGWMHGLGQCLAPTTVHGMGVRVFDEYTSVGIVAPCSDQATSRAQRLRLGEQEAAMGLAAYGAARLEHFAGSASAADVVDGFCLLLTRSLLDALHATGEGLVDPSLGTWAWADLCLRAADAGYRIAVSESSYVGRTSQVSLGHQQIGSLSDRLAFYHKHPRGPRADERLVVAVVVPAVRWQIVHSLRMATRRLAPLVDGLAIVLREDLSKLDEDPEYLQWRRSETQQNRDQRLTAYVMGRSKKGPGETLVHWLSACIAELPGRRIRIGGRAAADPRGIRCVFNSEPMEPHEQRSAAHGLAVEMGATAVLAMDYDEMLGAHITREYIDRLLCHPNPLVRGYDCGVAYHWDTPTLVREDAPWGHGGQYRGGQHGPRLMRLGAGSRQAQIVSGEGAGYVPDVGPTCLRPAAMTMRRFRFARPTDRVRHARKIGHEEGMRLTTYNGTNRMGLHMLLYEREEPEDVARWLDEVHALVDRVVLVWTGAWAEADKEWAGPGWSAMKLGLEGGDWPETGPGRALAEVAYLHGAQWVHEPLDDNIAQARNAGIQVLHEHGLRWAWFVDPDEWLPDPLADGVALRNMAGSSRWGWLMQVANYRTDGAAPTISDSVRISYLDPEGIMRMDGRVHEGFQQAIHTLQARGEHPRLVYAPFVLQHRGMAFDVERMDAKLTHYEHLLRLELEDSPHSPGAWVSLGWQYHNDGHVAEGLECYRRAIACAGNSYLPFKEMAYHHLREARALLGQCDARLVEGHQFHALCERMLQWLEKYAPPHPVIQRLEQRDPLPLPEWAPPAIEGASGYDVS